MPRGIFLDCCFQCPQSCGEPLLTHAPTWDPPTLTGSCGLVSYGFIALSSGSWYKQDFICALQDWSLCFPQSCGSPIIKSCWPSRSDSLSIPILFVRSQGCEAWCGTQNHDNNGETSLESLFSSLWVSHQWGWDLILYWLHSFYCLNAAYSLSLNVGNLFLVGSSIVVSMVVQQLIVILVLLQEEFKAYPSTLPSWHCVDVFLICHLS